MTFETIAPVRLGRVTEAAIAGFTVECFQREVAPPLGCLVVVEDHPLLLFAAVAAAQTEGVDPSRRIANRGEPDHDRERVLADNPHVPSLLVTTFCATIVGHELDGRTCHFLPPAPPPILARVRLADPAETADFTSSLDFLPLLLHAGPLADDVIAATLRNAARAHEDRYGFLVRAGKALAVLLSDDALRLSAILRRIQP